MEPRRLLMITAEAGPSLPERSMASTGSSPRSFGMLSGWLSRLRARRQTKDAVKRYGVLTLWTLDGRKRAPEALEGGVLGEPLGELDHARHIAAVVGEIVVVKAARAHRCQRAPDTVRFV